ncbi:hypothetical protein [Streptomyces sp. NPDC086787]|uniref:hypothetical protein n=1 Tax=Streptomyces sp. NPDC086787 TaxID=3365759 RepID=UPI0038292644
MSQSAPPPQPEQVGAAQPAQPAQPTQPFQPTPPVSPYIAQPGAMPPPMPAAPRKNNVAVGLITAVVAAAVVAALYGVVIGATKHEIGYAAVGVGFVIGLAAGRFGGQNPALPVVSAVLALGSVYLGQLIGEAVIGADLLNVGFNELFFQHFDIVQEAWKQDADPLTFLFFGLAAFAAFSGAKKAAA